VAGGSALSELRRYDGVSVVSRFDHAGVVAALAGQLVLPRLAARPPVPSWDDTTSRTEQVYFDALAAADCRGPRAEHLTCAS
jgi:hypothetical protein